MDSFELQIMIQIDICSHEITKFEHNLRELAMEEIDKGPTELFCKSVTAAASTCLGTSKNAIIQRIRRWRKQNRMNLQNQTQESVPNDSNFSSSEQSGQVLDNSVNVNNPEVCVLPNAPDNVTDWISALPASIHFPSH